MKMPRFIEYNLVCISAEKYMGFEPSSKQGMLLSAYPSRTQYRHLTPHYHTSTLHAGLEILNLNGFTHGSHQGGKQLKQMVMRGERETKEYALRYFMVAMMAQPAR